MKRFLPSRLSIHSEDDQPNSSIKKKSIKKSSLNSIKGIDSKVEAQLTSNNIVEIGDFMDSDISLLVEIFGGKKLKRKFDQIKEVKAEAYHILNDNTKLKISVLAPTEEAKNLLDKVNLAIFTLTKFTISSLSLRKAVQYNVRNGFNPYSFWVQDGFLALTKNVNTNIIKPVDASIGEIKHIAFNYYGGHDSDIQNSYNKIYADLIIKLSKIFRQWNQDLPSHQDDDGLSKMVLIEGRNGANQTNIVDVLLNNLDQEVDLKSSRKKSKTKLVLKGGNILFIGNRALVGYDLIIDSFIPDTSRGDLNKYKIKPNDDKRTVKKKKDDFNQLFKKYEKEFKEEFAKITHIGKDDEDQIIFIGSKEILFESINLDIDLFKAPGDTEEYRWIGNGDTIKHFSGQGIYHIDLFISAAGKDEFGNDRLLIGNPIHSGDEYIPAFNFTKKVINQIADQLVGEKITIYRNPLPLTYIDIEKNNTLVKRNWFFASYNNCIVQYINAQSKKNYVWMPTYGSDYSNEYLHSKNGENIECGDWSYLKEYDNENKRIWNSIGFKVELLTNYLPLAEQRGAVRCISKILRRKD